MPGRGRAEFQPIWSQDVAACIAAALAREQAARHERVELAGPETLTYDAMVRIALRGAGRERPLVHVPEPLVRGVLRIGETLLGTRAPAAWDEAELLEVSSTTPRGIADAQALGVTPSAMADVLGA